MISKAGTALSLLLVSLLALSLPSESSSVILLPPNGAGAGADNSLISSESLSSKGLTEQASFSYVEWLSNGSPTDGAHWASGTFILRPSPTEAYHSRLRGIWHDAGKQAFSISDIIRDEFILYANGTGGNWQAAWQKHREAVLAGLVDTTTDGLLNSFIEEGRRLSWVRHLEVDLQTELGKRPWSFGVDGIFSLQEKADSASGLQLRGFHSGAGIGANAGLFYRLAAGDNLLGSNIFLDYEKHQDGDSFWRWSLGGEWRSAYVDFTANRYWGITDGKTQKDGKYLYTADGEELELSARAPFAPWLSGVISYYDWEGEYGDKDDKGFRYGLRVDKKLGGLSFEVEYEDPDDGASGSWGGRVSYSKELGGVVESASSAEDFQFDPRAHFFDAARREYTQRLRQSNVSGISWYLANIIGDGGAVGNLFLSDSRGTSVNVQSIPADSQNVNVSYNGGAFSVVALLSLAELIDNQLSPPFTISVASTVGLRFVGGNRTLSSDSYDWSLDLLGGGSGGTYSGVARGGILSLYEGGYIVDNSVGVRKIWFGGSEFDISGEASLYLGYSSGVNGVIDATVGVGSGGVSLSFVSPPAIGGVMSTLAVSVVAGGGLTVEYDQFRVSLSSSGGGVVNSISAGAPIALNYSGEVVGGGQMGLIGALTATGGGGDYTYGLLSGAAGVLAVDTTSGALSLLISLDSTFITASATADDGFGILAEPATLLFTITINPVFLSAVVGTVVGVNALVPAGNINGLAATITGSGGDGAYTYNLVSGDNFYALGADGLLSLTVTDLAVFPATLAANVVVDDGDSSTLTSPVTVSYRITAQVPAALVLVFADVGVLVTGGTGKVGRVSGSGGRNVNTHRYTVLSDNACVVGYSNSVCSGTDGDINLTVAAPLAPGLVSITVRISDNNTPSVVEVLTITIVEGLVAPIANASTTVEAGYTGSVGVVTPAGGVSPYAYTLLGDSNFMVGANGELSLTTALTNATVTASVRVTDSDSPIATATAVLLLTVLPVELTAQINPVTNTITAGYTGSVGVVSVSGGISPYTYAISDVNFTVGTAGILSLTTALTNATITAIVEVRDSYSPVNLVSASLLVTVDNCSFISGCSAFGYSSNDSSGLSVINASVAQAMVNVGVDVNESNSDGYPAIFHILVFNTSIEVLSIFANAPGIDLNTFSPDNITPLHQVANQPSIPVSYISVLLDAGASVNVRTRSFLMLTPLDSANDEYDSDNSIVTRNVAKAELLISYGGKCNNRCQGDDIILASLSFSPATVDITTNGTGALLTVQAASGLGTAFAYTVVSVNPPSFATGVNLVSVDINGAVLNLAQTLRLNQNISIYVEGTDVPSNDKMTLLVLVGNFCSFISGCADLGYSSNDGDGLVTINVSLAQAMINAGADVNARGDSAETPLLHLAYHNRLDIITLLLDNGASINLTQQDDGRTPLDNANNQTNTVVASTLRSYGGKCSRTCLSVDITLAYVAFSTVSVQIMGSDIGPLSVVQAANGLGTAFAYSLLSVSPQSFSTHVNLVSVDGNSAVLNLVQTLAVGDSFIAYIEAEDLPFGDKATIAMEVASCSFFTGCLTLGYNPPNDYIGFSTVSLDTAIAMISAGADVNSRGDYASSALMIFAYYNRLDIISLMLDNGASVNLTHDAGYTAIDFAYDRRVNSTLAADVLRSYGGKCNDRCQGDDDISLASLSFSPATVDITTNVTGALLTVQAASGLGTAFAYRVVSVASTISFANTGVSIVPITLADGRTDVNKAQLNLLQTLAAGESIAVYVEVTDNNSTNDKATLVVEVETDPLPIVASFDNNQPIVALGYAGLVAQINASGGYGAYTYSLLGGGGNFALGADGRLSLTTAQNTETTLRVSVEVNDGHNNTTPVTLGLTLAALPLTASIINGKTFVASGYLGSVGVVVPAGGVSPYAYTLLGDSNFTVGANGILSLTTAFTDTTLTAAVTVTDSAFGVVTASLLITVGPCSFISGCAALGYSSSNGSGLRTINVSVAPAMLNAGADVNEAGASPVLVLVVHNNSFEVFSLFVQAPGIAINAIDPYDDRTALDGALVGYLTAKASLLRSFGAKCSRNCIDGVSGEISLASVSFSPATVSVNVVAGFTGGSVTVVQAASGLGTAFEYRVVSVSSTSSFANTDATIVPITLADGRTDVNKAQLHLLQPLALFEAIAVYVEVTDNNSTNDKATLVVEVGNPCSFISGCAALGYSSSNGSGLVAINVSLASVMIAAGADVNEAGTQIRVLTYVVYNNSFEVFSLFVQAPGIAINAIDPYDDRTALDAALSGYRTAKASLLRSFGAKCSEDCDGVSGEISLASVSFSPATVLVNVVAGFTGGSVTVVQAASGLGTAFEYRVVSVSSTSSFANTDATIVPITLADGRTDVNKAQLHLLQPLAAGETIAVYVEVTDNNSSNDKATLVVEAVDPLPIVASFDNNQPIVALGFIGSVAQVNASGGDGAYTYSLLGGGGNFALGADGRLSLTTAQNTEITLNVSVEVNDGHSNTTPVTLGLTLAALDLLAFTPPQDSIRLTTYNTAAAVYTVLAVSGQSGPVSYAILSTAPAGLNSRFAVGASDGVVTLQQLTTAERFSLYIRATNSVNETASFVLAVEAVDPQVIVASFDDNQPTILIGYTGSVAQVNASGGDGAYTYSLLGGGGNFALGADGRLSLTTAQNTEITLRVSVVVNDGHNNTTPVTLGLTLAALDVLAFTPPQDSIRLTTYNTAAAVYTVLAVSGQSGPVSYAILSTAPAGLNSRFAVGASDGVVTLQQLTTAERFSLYIRATNSVNETASFVLAVEAVDPLPIVASFDNNQPIVVLGYAGLVAQVNASGGDGAYTYSLLGGGGNFTISADGRLSLTTAQSTETTLNVSVEVNDGHNNTTPVTLGLTLAVIFPPLTASIINGNTLVIAGYLGSVGVVVPAGGVSPYAYTLLGDSNFTVGANGELSLITALTNAMVTASVEVTDSGTSPSTVTSILTVTVSPVPLEAYFSDASVEVPEYYTGVIATISVVGGVLPYSYTVSPTNEFSINTAGVLFFISGLTSGSTYFAIVEVEDSASSTAGDTFAVYGPP